MMKKTWVACAAGLLLVTGAANAISVSGEAGQHYTNLGVGMSTGSSGLGLTGNWARSDHDGNVGSVGLNFGVPLGPLTATVGAKALYLSPKDGKSGGAVALGGVGRGGNGGRGHTVSSSVEGVRSVRFTCSGWSG